MKKNILFPLVIFCILAPSLRAQLLSGGNGIAPGAPPPMVGVELGLGLHTQGGTFQASCNCEFASGSGAGFLGGLLFDLPLDYEWTVGIGAKFDLIKYSSTTNVVDQATITYNNSNNVASGYLSL